MEGNKGNIRQNKGIESHQHSKRQHREKDIASGSLIVMERTVEEPGNLEGKRKTEEVLNNTSSKELALG